MGFSAAQWTIEFNDHALCDGQDLGQKIIDLDDTTCYDDYSYIASGVLVNTTDPREQVVAFYQTPGCNTEDEIAVSNTPMCVGAVYGSFKVTNTYNDPSGCCLDAAVSSTAFHFDCYLTVLQYFEGNFEGTPTAPVISSAATLTVSITSSMLNEVPETASATSMSGIDITDIALTPRAIATNSPISQYPESKPKLRIGHDDSLGESPIYHGVVRVYGSERFKMHQLAHGVYRGVKLEDWDDSIHIKNDDKLELTEDERFLAHDSEPTESLGTSLVINPLDPRLFKYATCTQYPQKRCLASSTASNICSRRLTTQSSRKSPYPKLPHQPRLSGGNS